MRALICLALLCAGCSWDAEVANIIVQVNGIPAAADHLDVTLTPSDTSVQPKTFRPSFQPGAFANGQLELDFSAPSTTGTFTVKIVAADRTCPTPCTSGLAGGTVSGPEPSAGNQTNLQVTLH